MTVFTRPDTIDAAPLLERIEAMLAQQGMSATTFGREALCDPSLVFQLRRGRLRAFLGEVR